LAGHSARKDASRSRKKKKAEVLKKKKVEPDSSDSSGTDGDDELDAEAIQTAARSKQPKKIAAKTLLKKVQHPESDDDELDAQQLRNNVQFEGCLTANEQEQDGILDPEDDILDDVPLSQKRAIPAAASKRDLKWKDDDDSSDIESDGDGVLPRDLFSQKENRICFEDAKGPRQRKSARLSPEYSPGSRSLAQSAKSQDEIFLEAGMSQLLMCIKDLQKASSNRISRKVQEYYANAHQEIMAMKKQMKKATGSAKPLSPSQHQAQYQSLESEIASRVEDVPDFDISLDVVSCPSDRMLRNFAEEDAERCPAQRCPGRCSKRHGRSVKCAHFSCTFQIPYLEEGDSG